MYSRKFGYNHTKGNLDNLSLEIDDDLDFSLQNIGYIQDLYSFAIFHRSYVGLDRSRRFGLFNETSIGYNTATTRFTRDKGADLKATDTRIHYHWPQIRRTVKRPWAWTSKNANQIFEFLF